MTENQRKVYEILESNGGWMSIKDIKDIANKGDFEKYSSVTSCLIAFVKQGYVERKTQELLNGNTMAFYRLAKKHEPKKLWFIEQADRFGYTIEMKSFSSKEEALNYINLKKLNKHGILIPIESTYRVYEAQEVGEY